MMRIEGDHVSLRPMRPEEIELIHTWANNPDVMPYWYGRIKSLEEIKADWTSDYFTDDDLYTGRCFAIEKENTPIGMICYNRIDHENQSVELDMLIGDKDYWNKGLGSDALWAFVRLLFSNFLLNRIWLGTYAYNQRALWVYEKVGFKRAGNSKKHEEVRIMRKSVLMTAVLVLILTMAFSPPPAKKLKIFISVDMEGVAGVVSGRECSSSGPDYDYFRELMTLEANAAVAGALSAGAAEIVVRDGHGAKTNIRPALLHKKAKLLRGVTTQPENMMLGIDESFDAVLFIGYHAKAGTEEGVLAHTSSGNVIDLSINGVSLPEVGYNALIAGLYDVPVVFLAGDNWICQQAKDLFGELSTVETKVGMGTAELGLHPEIVRQLIRDAVYRALRDPSGFQPYKLKPPYTMKLKVKKERELYPGAEKTGEGEFTFASSDLLEVMDAFNHMK